MMTLDMAKNIAKHGHENPMIDSEVYRMVAEELLKEVERLEKEKEGSVYGNVSETETTKSICN